MKVSQDKGVAHRSKPKDHICNCNLVQTTLV